jgi:hypothetical protein
VQNENEHVRELMSASAWFWDDFGEHGFSSEQFQRLKPEWQEAIRRAVETFRGQSSLAQLFDRIELLNGRQFGLELWEATLMMEVADDPLDAVCGRCGKPARSSTNDGEGFGRCAACIRCIRVPVVTEDQTCIACGAPHAANRWHRRCHCPNADNPDYEWEGAVQRLRWMGPRIA